VIADLTADNPNVYYELGFRHALERPFIHLVRGDHGRLPFDLQDFDVISIPARFVEDRDDASQSYFSIRDDHLEQVRGSLLAQLDSPLPPGQGTKPTEPFSAKVYRWDVFYSPRIAADWLAAQPDTLQKQIGSYESGGGTDSVAEESLTLFAEYLALKAAACLTGEGTIVMIMNNGALDFGHAVFKFSTAPEPILIDVKSVSCNGNGVASITFKQESRPFPIERGGRTVNVRIPGYMYTLQISVSDADGTANGVILHPDTKTAIGKTVISPRCGASFR
jgi:hypothetical protein